MSTPQQSIQIALEHQKAGRLQEAEAIYRQVLRSDPVNVPALHLLGLLANQSGRVQEAIELIERSIQLAPKMAQLHQNLGEVYRGAGRDAAAAPSYRRAIELGGATPEMLHKLGMVLLRQGKAADAAEVLVQLAGLRPDDPATRVSCGIALLEAGQNARAAEQFRLAIALRPQETALQSEAYLGLGTALLAERKTVDAVPALQKAVELNPASAQTWSQLAIATGKQMRLKEAVAAARKAVELAPADALAHAGLGDALRLAGRSAETIASYRKAVELKADLLEAWNNLLMHLTFTAEVDGVELRREHERAARLSGLAAAPRPSEYPNVRAENRRLRVGYFSPDFWQHSVAYFLEAVLEHHDHSTFEIVCYSDVVRADEVTARLQAHADIWRNIRSVADSQVEQLIHDDRIDLLVDLAGHTAGNRLAVLAHKPAPVQIHYLGYLATTGMEAIDWRITDEYTDPAPEADAHFTEKLIRLPRTGWAYRPSPKAPAIGPLPADGNGYITFGSFNNLLKATPRVLEVWAQLLKRVPDSRLLLKAATLADADVRAEVQEILAARGVATEQLELRPMTGDTVAHLNLYNRVDIALDTFPYNGATTTCEAMWMGCPVVCLRGNRHAGRIASSMLINAGLPKLVADSPEQYVQIAAALAGDVQRLRRLRGGLREQLRASPLLDTASCTRHVEAAYRRTWQQWCAGQ